MCIFKYLKTTFDASEDNCDEYNRYEMCIAMRSNTHVMNVNALQEIRPPNHSS